MGSEHQSWLLLYCSLLLLGLVGAVPYDIGNYDEGSYIQHPKTDIPYVKTEKPSGYETEYMKTEKPHVGYETEKPYETKTEMSYGTETEKPYETKTEMSYGTETKKPSYVVTDMPEEPKEGFKLENGLYVVEVETIEDVNGSNYDLSLDDTKDPEGYELSNSGMVNAVLKVYEQHPSESAYDDLQTSTNVQQNALKPQHHIKNTPPHVQRQL